MIILDTDVLSALMLAPWPEHVVTWLDRQPERQVWIASVTLYEIRVGLRFLPVGKRRTASEAAFELAVNQVIESRVLPFDA